MAEYIEREAFIAHIEKDPLYPLIEKYGVKGVIEAFPAAGVQPVRHGRWEKKHDDVCYWHECSECGERLPLNQWRQPWKSPYCPNCGAKTEVTE